MIYSIAKLLKQFKIEYGTWGTGPLTIGSPVWWFVNRETDENILSITYDIKTKQVHVNLWNAKLEK